MRGMEYRAILQTNQGGYVRSSKRRALHSKQAFHKGKHGVSLVIQAMAAPFAVLSIVSIMCALMGMP